MLKKTIFFILIIISAFYGYGQKPNRGLIGLNVNGTYYLGDLNKTIFGDMSYAAGGFFKHPIDSRFLLAANFNYIKLKGSGKFYENSQQDRSFNSTAYDLSMHIEFNFIPFIVGNKKYDYTPYIFAGFGTAYYTQESTPFILSIPFGIGYKQNINERFSYGIYYSMRKTFTDKIDYESPQINHALNNSYQENYFGNSDWFSVFGIYLAYKINYRMKCPAFD